MKFKQIVLCAFIFISCFYHPVFADEYVVAVRAKNGVDAALIKWQPTLDYLAQTIEGGHAFRLMPVLSLDELMQRTGQGEFDFVLTNPSSFVEIKQRHGLKPLVTLINK